MKTKKTELLFLALFLKLLKPGGRAAVIVPDGVLFGSSKAHKTLRQLIVDDQKLDAVVKLPSGVFRPYAGDVDGHPVLHQNQLRRHRQRLVLRRPSRRPLPRRQTQPRRHQRPPRRPGALAQPRHKGRPPPHRPVLPRPTRPTSSPKATTSSSTATKIEYDEGQGFRPPLDIIADIEKLDAEITQGIADLKAMLS